jgi:hypothetical protein
MTVVCCACISRHVSPQDGDASHPLTPNLTLPHLQHIYDVTHTGITFYYLHTYACVICLVATIWIEAAVAHATHMRGCRPLPAYVHNPRTSSFHTASLSTRYLYSLYSDIIYGCSILSFHVYIDGLRRRRCWPLTDTRDVSGSFHTHAHTHLIIQLFVAIHMTLSFF